MNFPSDKRSCVPVHSIPEALILSCIVDGADLFSSPTAPKLMRQRSKPGIKDGRGCWTCRLSFETVAEQRSHFKGDVHLFNIKRAAHGQQPLTPDEVESLVDIDSISGSVSSDESDAEEDIQPSDIESDAVEAGEAGALSLGNMVMFKSDTHALSLYTNTLTSQKRHADPGALIEQFVALRNFSWAIILLRSGHFAAGIFGPDGRVTHHKTFHRYTVRRKAGGSQSSFDSNGKAAKSAGATLRRYNEQALANEVNELFTKTWAGSLAACQLVFLSCGASTRPMFFKPFSSTKSACFDRSDSRLRNVPFPTDRPTLNEVKRVYTRLSQVQVCPLHFLPVEPVSASLADMPPPPATDSKSGSGGQGGGQVESDNEEDKVVPLTALSEAAAEGKVEVVRALLEGVGVADGSDGDRDMDVGEVVNGNSNSESVGEGGIAQTAAVGEGVEEGDVVPATTDGGVVVAPPVVVDINARSGVDEMTALHAAAAGGHVGVVRLLLGAGCDPTVLDSHLRTPYLVSKDKASRNVFREYVAQHPEQWDYDAAHIPDALTDDMKKRQKEKEREKKKRARAKKKVAKDEVAMAAEAEAKAKAEAEAVLAAQAAAADAGDKCDNCGKGMLRNDVPFFRLDFKYCSSECVQRHKRVLMADAAARRFGGS